MKATLFIEKLSTNRSSIVNKDCFTRIDKKNPEDFVNRKKKYAHQKYVILLNNNEPPRIPQDSLEWIIFRISLTLLIFPVKYFTNILKH